MEYHGLRTDLINTTANTVTVIWLHDKRFECQPHSLANAFNKEHTSLYTTLCTVLTIARDLFSAHYKRCNCYFHTEVFGTIWQLKCKESARAVSFTSYREKHDDQEELPTLEIHKLTNTAVYYISVYYI